MVIMHHWQSLSLWIETYKQKRVDKKKKDNPKDTKEDKKLASA